MNHHYSSGKCRLLKRIFSICIALLMVCSVSVPVFAASVGNDTDDMDGNMVQQPAPAITYNFYAEGELYDSQIIQDGEALSEPAAPEKDGSIFDGWYNSETDGEKFTDFSQKRVTETAAVNLYARWQEVQDTSSLDEEGIEEEEPLESADLLLQKSVSVLQSESAEEDPNFIVVEKKFVGIKKDQIPDNFQITVASGTAEYVLTKNTDSWTETVGEDGTVTWRWKVTGVGTGIYTVSEQNENISDYNVVKTGEGSVEVKAAEIGIRVKNHETTCSHTNWPVKIEGDQNVLFAATLTQGGVAVISKESLPASQRAAVAEEVTKINGPWKNPVYFYSIAEQNQSGQGFELNGATITYDADSGEVIIGNTSNWQHVATLGYSISQASNPEISITNTYTPSTRDITIKKVVTGGLGDVQKDFNFTYSYTNASGVKTGSFTLKNDGTYTIAGIPVSGELTLTETNAEGYVTTAQYGASTVSVSGNKENAVKSMAITINKDDNMITVTNHKEAIPDTGVYMDSLPYILIFALVIAGTAVLIVRKCKRRYI